jgi:hypothetical protein
MINYKLMYKTIKKQNKYSFGFKVLTIKLVSETRKKMSLATRLKCFRKSFKIKAFLKNCSLATKCNHNPLNLKGNSDYA